MTVLKTDLAFDEFVARLEESGLVLVARQRTPWQPWMDSFLNALARRNGNARLASEEVEVSRQTIYKYRSTCKEFRRRWKQIVEQAKAVARSGE